MSGILRLESLTKGNTLKQGDKTPLKYRLFDADGEKLNIAGKSATVRLVYPDFLTIGYEKGGLTVAQDDTVTFTIDTIIPSRIYHVEIIVDDKFIFPSRADESKFTVDKSSLGTETNIIEVVGVDAVVRKAVDLINDDPNLIIDEDKLVTDIISNTGIGNIEEYYQAYSDVIKELSENKDYHSLPEISGARGGFGTLGDRLNHEVFDMSRMGQDVKEAMTGGSVAVVGEGAVGSENLKESAVEAINTNDNIAVRTLLKASSTRRIPHTLEDNTPLLSEESISINLLRSTSTIKAGEFYTFVLKTNITDPSTVNFRLNVRNASNTIIKTLNFEYLGQGVFGILDFQSADENRLQFVFQNLTTIERSITTFIISEGGYPLGDFVLDVDAIPEFTGLNSLLNTSEKNIESGNVSYYNGSTTETLTTKFTETIALPTGHYVYGEYGNAMENGSNYTFVAQTDTKNPNFSNMFRLQKRLGGTIVETIYSKNAGNGLFIIPDVEYESGHEYRLIVRNELDDTVNLKRVLSGKNGIPTIKQESNSNLQPYVYPLYPVWGHEYLYSWYEKIVNDAPLKMIWAGDSTTLNSDVPTNLTRSELGKLIMTKGGYPDTDITSINAGHGTQHTGNWLGGEYDEDKRTENGFLDEDMLQNPDLYIFGYSHNDGSDGHFGGLTWEERVRRFETNLNIGLERIRGSMYNKSPDDMAIILCMPNSANGAGGHTHDLWYDRIRPIIQKAARDYKCAFVDITARQYDHSFSSDWSTNADNTHPTGIANLDYMSMFADLLFPYLMHK